MFFFLNFTVELRGPEPQFLWLTYVRTNGEGREEEEKNVPWLLGSLPVGLINVHTDFIISFMSGLYNSQKLVLLCSDFLVYIMSQLSKTFSYLKFISAIWKRYAYYSLLQTRKRGYFQGQDTMKRWWWDPNPALSNYEVYAINHYVVLPPSRRYRTHMPCHNGLPMYVVVIASVVYLFACFYKKPEFK